MRKRTPSTFVMGDPRAGRKPGSRSRLSSKLIQDLYDEWVAGGRDALRIMRIEEPGAFVKCALATLPREWLIESVASELDDDELDAQIAFIREQLAKMQEPKLIEVKANDGNGSAIPQRE
jgi:hypothetical protein